MKNKQNRCTAWVSHLVLGFGAGSLLMLPTAAMAQTNPTADETIWGGGTVSVDGDNGAASSLLDIIQRGQVGPTQSTADFNEGLVQGLDNEARKFLQLQLEAAGKTTSASTATTDSASASEGVDDTVETKATMDAMESETTDDLDVQSQEQKADPRPALW